MNVESNNNPKAKTETESGLVLVTGSSGRIGSAVMRRFAGRFGEVVGFDREAPKSMPPGCTHMPVEITSEESVSEGLRVLREHHGSNIVSVIHLAAYYDFFGEPSEKYDEITVKGTRRLLKGLREHEFDVEQFVFSSTMLVHRPAEPGQFINEDWPIEATWAYPESKVRTEKVIHKERGSIPAVLLRIAGVYDDLSHSIPLAHQMQRINERQLTSRIYSGSTSHGQSFVHMDDLVEAIALTVERRADLPKESPILIGEPETLSYDELQHTFARLIHGEELETIEVPGALAPLAKAGAWVLEKLPGADEFIKPWMIDRANDHYALDITRARTLLGWEPKRSLRETIPKMVAALKADPLNFYQKNDLELTSELVEQAETKAKKMVNPVEHKHTKEPEETSAPKKKSSSSGDAEMKMPDGTSMKMSDHKSMSMPDEKTAASGMTVESGITMGHGATVWPHFANMILGFWLITNTFALGYRSVPLQVSDIVSGVLVIFLAILSVSATGAIKFWSPWLNSLVGVWLFFAPLVFWAPTSAVYSNDTLIGALVVVFAILAPGMPMAKGMSMEPGPDVPLGWSYNPSSWPQRAPIIALALIGFFLSRQMTAFQLQHITSLIDPIFRLGTETVLTSDVSRSFPIPDAGLGAVAYMVEFLMGFMGDKARWRTMPWMVTFFGILVVPLGVVSITLIVLQPLAVGAWCTPCLIAAAAMVIMIALTLDEVVAMIQFLIQAGREGQPLWQIFWLGGSLKNPPEKPAVKTRPDVVSPGSLVWGVTLPWNLLVSAALGIWLMIAPSAFGSTGTAAHSDHLIGALIVTASVIALADVGRSIRFINVLFGALIIIAAWVWGDATPGARWNDLVIGVLVILLSFPRGKIGDLYGDFQRFIR